jgi:hypothetical protein
MPLQINLCANITHITKLPLSKQTNGSINMHFLAHSSGGGGGELTKKQNKEDVTKFDIKIVMKVINHLYI